MNPMLLWRTLPSPSRPAAEPPAPDALAAEVARLREENAILRIRLTAAENRTAQVLEMHAAARESWTAIYTRDIAIHRAALLDVHAAVVHDRLSPEDQACAGLVIQ